MKKRIPCKKFLTVGLCLTLVGIMTACSGNNTAAKSGDSQTQAPEVKQPISMTEENLSTGTTAPMEETGTAATETSAAEADVRESCLVDGAFQLTTIMNNNGFYDLNGNGLARSELGGYACSFEGINCHITIVSMPKSGTTIFQIYDDDARIVYQANFDQGDVALITTDYENITLGNAAKNTLCSIMPELSEKMQNDSCPFAGLNVEHGLVDNKNNKTIVSHDD